MPGTSRKDAQLLDLLAAGPLTAWQIQVVIRMTSSGAYKVIRRQIAAGKVRQVGRVMPVRADRRKLRPVRFYALVPVRHVAGPAYRMQIVRERLAGRWQDRGMTKC